MQRTEYPRPQMVRNDWINLNGEWEYLTDRACSGTERKLYEESADFNERIEVPFCRESVLSGIGDRDFCACVWYRRRIDLPAEWKDKRVVLHLGACNYRTTLWVNGQEAGTHCGGFGSFSFDITRFLGEGQTVLTLRVFNDVRSGRQPAGKQSSRYESYSCFYTRTTGIWQTVWLEATEKACITGTKYYPDIDAQTLTAHILTVGAEGMTVKARALYDGKEVGTASATVNGKEAVLTVALSELHLWEVGHGRLYDLELTLGDDRVMSYFGMRNIGLRDGVLYLNHQPVFQRLVLDQGFYPDGILTAPSDEALKADILRSMALGFNGARLHQKIFEPRFLTHCDRLGYLVWGEEGNWGADLSLPDAWGAMLPEWLEAVERDFNHPAIIGWCPLNETQENQKPELVRFLADITRALDPTRLFIEASGWYHVPGIADIVDLHNYEQNPQVLAAFLEPLRHGKEITLSLPHQRKEVCKPTFISEYGGIHWNMDHTYDNSWGYGNSPRSEEEFKERFRGLTETILFHPSFGALCYTQLTDVEQEQNGLYTYDRREKFDPAFFRAILSQKAAVEDGSDTEKEN